MEIFENGRIYVGRGEHLPAVCPNCEHIMHWDHRKALITCEKCEYRGTPDEFSKADWTIVKPN